MEQFFDIKLLPLLLEVTEYRKIELNKLLEQYGYTKAQLNYRINKINKYLKKVGIEEIKIHNGMVISLFKYEQIENDLLADPLVIDGILLNLSLDERICLECVYVFCSLEPLSLYHFQSIFHVSRNTILNDIKLIKIKLSKKDVSLSYNRADGYYFVGKGETIRELIYYCIDKFANVRLFISLINCLFKTKDYQYTCKQIELLIKQVLQSYDLQWENEYLCISSCLLTLLLRHAETKGYVVISPSDGFNVQSQAFSITDEIYKNLPCKLPTVEKQYIALIVIYMTQSNNMILETLQQNAQLYESLAVDIINRFMFIMHMESKNMSEAVAELSHLLQNAYFRVYYGFPAKNAYLMQIKKNNREMFHVVKMVFHNITLPFKINLNEDEIGYIMSHFMTILDNGSVVPDLEQATSSPDNQQINVDELFNEISDYFTVKDGMGLRNLLSSITFAQYKILSEVFEPPSLKKVLRPEYINFHGSCDDWEHAIKVASEPLIQYGCIRPGYVDAMIRTVHERGPYIVVYPNFALSHAYPGDNVKQIGISFLHLEEPVYLLNQSDKGVRIVIVLSAVDTKLHRRAIGELATVLSKKKNREMLLSAKNKNDVLEVIFN